jgi:hypothetical protein
MAAHVGSRLSTATPYIKDLNTQVRKGEIKVPQFQRPFVWGVAQALDLLDSVANNYPIGSLLLWRTADKLATERNIGEFKLPETEDLTPTDYVLDGQQRMTVLYSALGAEDEGIGFSAVYDLEAEKFLEEKPGERPLHHFPMRWLYQTTKLLNFRTALQSHKNADLLQERFDALIEVFSGYQIPVVTLRDLTIEEVCPIFERINSSGTDLSTFDLMVAATWSKGFDLNEKVQEISYSLEPKNYGEIKGTTVLKCLSVVQYESANRERVIALRGFKGSPDKMDSLVDRTRKALLRAVDQLATDFKIHSLSFLPYEAHLVILTYIYANNPNLSAQALRRVRQWFWRTSFSERYRGAPDDFVTRDLQAIKSFVLEGEDGSEETFGTGLTNAEIKKMVFRKNNSRSRAFILALAKNNPKNLTNGNTIDTSEALSVYNRKQFHHIFPEAFLKRTAPGVERSNLLNFCMLAAADNNRISDRDPKDYLPELIGDLGLHADDVLRSNLMPTADEYDYTMAELGTFFDARVDIVRREIFRLCSGAH